MRVKNVYNIIERMGRWQPGQYIRSTHSQANIIPLQSTLHRDNTACNEERSRSTARIRVRDTSCTLLWVRHALDHRPLDCRRRDVGDAQKQVPKYTYGPHESNTGFPEIHNVRKRREVRWSTS